MTNDDFPSSLERRDWIRLVGAGSVAALAGCLGGGGSNGSGGNNGSGNSGNESDGGNGGGDVLVWSAIFDDSDTQPWFNWYKKDFGKNHKQATLKTGGSEYDSIRKKYLTGAKQGKPDAVEGVFSHLTEYREAGLIAPIGDRAKKLDFFSGYKQNAIDAVTYKDEIYGLPYTGNGRALVYRKDIFDKHGLKPPKTTEDFIKAGRTIKAKEEDITPYHNCTKKGGVRAFQEWISHMYQVVDNVYKPKGDGWKVVPSADQIGTVFDDIYHKPWASDDPIADPKQLGTGWQTNDYGYVNGNYAMIECGPWLRGFTSGDEIDNSGKAKKLLTEKTGIANLPYPEGGSKGTYLEVKPVMLNKYSKSSDLAFDALAEFASPKSMNQLGDASPGSQVTPVHKQVKSTLSDKNWKPFTEVFNTAKPLAKVTWGPVREAFYPLQQQVAYGKSDPYDAGKEFHKQLKSLESSI